tara:strand:+ start:143 stop:850 length:708 start_codon:yes stop_codon:yes gene_type:complete
MSWSNKYKKSIDCNNPKGFSQKAHCKGKKKRNETSMKLSEFKEAVKNVLRERSINAISKLQQKNIENIEKALEFYKKNKHTDKKEPFIKLLKKLGKEKIALAKELDMKVSGMYKNAEYKGENVVMNHDGKSAPYGSGYEKVNESVVNEMSMGFDNMTGLFYVKGVPFTRERIKEVLQFFMKSKAKSAINQFEYTPSLIVKDKANRHEVIIDPKNLKTLVDFYKKNSAKLASDKDF